MNKSVNVTDKLYRYLIDTSLREPEILRKLREENMGQQPRADLQIAPEQGQFLHLLTRAFGFRRAIEIGVFTGYSCLSVALAMPRDGRIVACDISKESTDIARRYWVQAGVTHKIDLRLAPALVTLDSMLAAGEASTYDFVFIDADKINYLAYYERAMILLKPGGLIAIDNTLWYGFVADPAKQDADTSAIRAVNRRVYDDDRVLISMLPVADGLTLALKLA